MSILHADPEPFTAQKFEFGLEFRFSHIVLTERPFGYIERNPNSTSNSKNIIGEAEA